MIDLIKINKFYNSGENKLHVLKNVSLDINSGDFVAIMGESGSGKSTLINILGFLDKNFTGIYRFENVEISKFSDNKLSDLRNKSVGFIFQQFQLIQTYTIAENVELPLLYQGKSYKYAREKALKALDLVGIKNQADKKPKQLSGGQQQRAAIARAIVHNPKFIIADEPTGALDSETSKEIMTLFDELNKKLKITIIMVTHDKNITHNCNRKYFMLDGVLQERDSYEV
ncbi:ABC transporter ATP-binding protein [Finegoldia magna]|uniref:ABC transporter ATP-binding protein n=1 Tax=Finegoldia magna TaxID=1260 RepID=A0A233W814_FINMA|nr:ABC transporter ATP-binding protein [Finegoldia magna]EGS32610.1 ABC transporter, ATP-binding protein [Finegoldia magna SY403409CC001050417]MDU4731442.1 ABC transporter ATP-binding protein [Finegoldia magna]MDU5272061.1 ABC transporter ATP-binding protein [Finegoldia magna]MDU5742869.1 ABC transporter ATP-binding protein [Finegoldia magna]MDU5924462.1 ABC transporter ATP-binding protein [Finegoldia magna]